MLHLSRGNKFREKTKIEVQIKDSSAHGFFFFKTTRLDEITQRRNINISVESQMEGIREIQIIEIGWMESKQQE